jgi:hypothetical protein
MRTYRSARTGANVAAVRSGNSRNETAAPIAPPATEYEINRGFNHYSPGVFTSWFSRMAEAVQSVAAYASSIPSRETLRTTRELLMQRQQNAHDAPIAGNKESYYSTIAEAQNLANQLADWVSAAHPTNKETATIVGFDIRKTRNNITPRPNMVTSLRMLPPQEPLKAVFTCDIARVNKAAVRYNLEISVDNGATWTLNSVTTNSRRIESGVLEYGKTYLFRVYAASTGGNGPASNPPIPWIAQ